MFSFSKEKRVRRSSDFQKLSREGAQKTCRLFIICKKNTSEQPKLGITVSRKYGKAHVRNRFKRIVREAFRLSYQELPPCSINIIARKEALNAGMEDIRKELLESI